MIRNNLPTRIGCACVAAQFGFHLAELACIGCGQSAIERETSLALVPQIWVKQRESKGIRLSRPRHLRL